MAVNVLSFHPLQKKKKNSKGPFTPRTITIKITVMITILAAVVQLAVDLFNFFSKCLLITIITILAYKPMDNVPLSYNCTTVDFVCICIFSYKFV